MYVKFVCVKLLYVKFVIVVCVRRREEEEEKEPGIQNQKQEPHTKLWGISPVSSVKCLGKKKSHDMGPLQLFGLHKYAKHVMSTNSHSVHFTSHMNKDSI